MKTSTRYIPPVFHRTPSACSVDHSSGLVFRRPQAASHRCAVVYFCSAVLKRATSQLSMMLRSQQVTANVEEIPDESMHG